jgi:hypothetical protein
MIATALANGPESSFGEALILVALIPAAYVIVSDRLQEFRSRFGLPRGWSAADRTDDDGTTWTPAPFGHEWTPTPPTTTPVFDWAATDEAHR